MTPNTQTTLPQSSQQQQYLPQHLSHQHQHQHQWQPQQQQQTEPCEASPHLSSTEIAPKAQAFSWHSAYTNSPTEGMRL